MGMLDPAELKKLPVVRWIESTSVDRALIVTGKALVYVGIVAGLYVLWIMSTPRAGFFGIGARGADVTFAGLLASGVVVLYHVALGFICQGIGRGIQLLDSMGPPQTPIVDPQEPSH